MKTKALIIAFALALILALYPAAALADEPPCCTVFFPLIFGGAPAEPTPLPPTDPLTGTVQTLWPVKVVGVVGQWQDYDSALAGTGDVGGSDILAVNPFYTPESMPYSLINQFFFGVSYQIFRDYVEFDTTAIPADFETAQFNFTIYLPCPGPPAHHVAVHRGTWPDDGLTDADHQFLPENWSAYEPTPLAILPGGDPDVSELQIVSVTLLRDVINPGGITKLAFRSTVEGTVPDTNLGGAFAGLSLKIR